MNRDSKFWISLVAFQICFGLAVFALTRAHYMQSEAAPIPAATSVSSEPASVSQSAAAPASTPAPTSAPVGLQPGGLTEMVRERLDPTANAPASDDPVALAQQAAAAFSAQNYARAADLYQKLLTFNPKSADVLNELGLTLHYTGRSQEGLQRLKEGVAADPKHQRIRLTLGFVNFQLGNYKEARAALTAATQLGTDQGVRQSAQDMLKQLPQ